MLAFSPMKEFDLALHPLSFVTLLNLGEHLFKGLLEDADLTR
jgi:hypothetical protein